MVACGLLVMTAQIAPFVGSGEIYSLFPVACTDLFGRKYALVVFNVLSALLAAFALRPMRLRAIARDRLVVERLGALDDPRHRGGEPMQQALTG